MRLLLHLRFTGLEQQQLPIKGVKSQCEARRGVFEDCGPTEVWLGAGNSSNSH